jgi:hypothetical protein
MSAPDCCGRPDSGPAKQNLPARCGRDRRNRKHRLLDYTMIRCGVKRYVPISNGTGRRTAS